MRRVVAIVDGEHYPPVVRAALEEIDDLVVAAVLVGGTEKLRGDVDGYGVPLEPTVEAAIDRHQPDLILDLSDEPVLGPPERFALASRVLALGLPYEGPDFRFDPPPAIGVDVPTLAVIGTGKRVGKTAVTGHVARRLASTRRTVVVAMGREGRPSPRSSSPGRRSRRCSSSRATAGTRHPTISRRQSSRASRRWDAAAAAAGWPAPSRCPTSSRACWSRPVSARSWSSSTAAGPHCRPSPPIAGCSSHPPHSRWRSPPGT